MQDLSRVPLVAVSEETKHLISTLVNPPKVIPASNGLLRDWRGFAQVCSIDGVLIPALAADPDPVKRILSIVQQRCKDFTLESLKAALEKIERWDVADDSQPYLEKDAKLYEQRLEKSQTTTKINNFATESDVLTLDDQYRIERGEESQHYDAFLLYADEDEAFAAEIVENLETKNKLKLCLKERDLIAGISFEHKAIMRLISERCNRLIAIISPEFLKSPANQFFLNFAQASAIDQTQERKVIPCICKICDDLPQQLTYFTKIYYTKPTSEYFWKKLVNSTKAVSYNQDTQKTDITSKKSSSNIEKKNGFVQSTPVEENKIEEVGESSKSAEATKNRSSFSWIKKQKVEVSKESLPSDETTTEESIPSLPSLGELDSPSSVTSDTKTQKDKKKKKLLEKIFFKS